MLSFGQSPWVNLARFTTKNLSRVSFVDSLTGWVAGDSGGIFRTTNGGQSWEAQDTKITNNIFDLFFVDRSYGWAVALQYMQDTSWYGTVLLRTTNGGTTWMKRNLPMEYFYTLAFFDSANGWMAGHDGKLRKTTDGGITWSNAVVDSSVVMGFPIKHLDFYSRNYGFAVGGSIDAAGVVWKTTNGGDRWAAVNPDGDGEPLHGTHFIDSLNVMAVGETSISDPGLSGRRTRVGAGNTSTSGSGAKHAPSRSEHRARDMSLSDSRGHTWSRRIPGEHGTISPRPTRKRCLM